MSTTETKVRHTPGRWGRNVAPASKYPTIFAGRNTHVAMVVSQGLPAEEVEANCNLIAAAPDLLEALEDLVQAHDVKMGASAVQLRIDRAKDAIAKARGGAA